MKMIILYLNRHPEFIDQLLNRIDDIMDDEIPGTGLPVQNEPRERIRKAIIDWVKKLLLVEN